MKVSKFKVSRQSVSSTTNINANWLHNSSQHDPIKACSNKHHLKISPNHKLLLLEGLWVGPPIMYSQKPLANWNSCFNICVFCWILIWEHLQIISTPEDKRSTSLPMTCSENACSVAEVAAAWYTLVHAACTWFSCTDSEWVNYTTNVKEKIHGYILLHDLDIL